jgi:AhpD family alkylhydroperoxidase
MSESTRINPVPPAEWTDEQHQVLDPLLKKSGASSMLGTFVHHWEAFKAWHGGLAASTLSARQRELIILRTGFVTPCEYEWAQHKTFARAAGISDEEIERVKQGGAADGWTGDESALLDMTDELIARHAISDSLWLRLTRYLSIQQIIDCVYLVGTYLTVAFLGNVMDVKIEPGFTGFDPDKVFG